MYVLRLFIDADYSLIFLFLLSINNHMSPKKQKKI